LVVTLADEKGLGGPQDGLVALFALPLAALGAA